MIRFIHHFNYPSGVSRGDGEAWYLGTHVPLIRELPGVLRYRSWRQIEVGISYPSAGLLRKITALPVPAGLVIRQRTNCFFHAAFDLVARSAHYTVLLLVKTIARPVIRLTQYVCAATTTAYLVNGRLLLLGDRSLTGIRDIHGATGLQDFLRAIALFAFLCRDGEQDVPVFDLSLVAFRLILGNTHADERSGKASGRRAARCACQSRHDRARCDKNSKPRNRQCSDTNHPAQRSSQDCASACASRSALGSLGVLLVGEILGSLLVGEKNRYVVVGKASRS